MGTTSGLSRVPFWADSTLPTPWPSTRFLGCVGATLSEGSGAEFLAPGRGSELRGVAGGRVVPSRIGLRMPVVRLCFAQVAGALSRLRQLELLRRGEAAAGAEERDASATLRRAADAHRGDLLPRRAARADRRRRVRPGPGRR